MAVRARRRPPLSDAVRDDLRRLILTGSFPAGSRLPNEPDLCERYDVSRITLREAVQGLVQEGYLLRRQGSGTYVTRRPTLQNSLDQNFSYTDYLRQAGIRAGRKVLSAKVVPADAKVAEALSLEPDTKVVEIKRLRTADGQPAVYSVDTIPSDIVNLAEDRPALRGSLYRLLLERGHPVDHGEAIVAPAMAEDDLADHLQVAPGTLLQHLEQIDYDAADRPVMCSLEWHVPSVFEVRVYRRGPGRLVADQD
ncbi:MAG TPA: GntR family transcriptional regulator [Gaiellaceae bacterium]|jgi:DNA-binding GntR family transcriptional regulator